MLTSVRRIGVASLALTAFVTTAGATGLGSPALAAEAHHHHGPGAVFVQTDDPAGNTVVAYDRAAGRQPHAGRQLRDRRPRRRARRLGRRPPRLAGLARLRPRTTACSTP